SREDDRLQGVVQVADQATPPVRASVQTCEGGGEPRGGVLVGEGIGCAGELTSDRRVERERRRAGPGGNPHEDRGTRAGAEGDACRRRDGDHAEEDKGPPPHRFLIGSSTSTLDRYRRPATSSPRRRGCARREGADPFRDAYVPPPVMRSISRWISRSEIGLRK